MRKYSHSNLIDFLMENLPELRDKMEKVRNNVVNAKKAETLFAIWKNKENQVSNTVFKKSDKVSNEEIDGLQKEGLIKSIGDKLQITSKGVEVIKTMVLGDERSIFDENGKDVNYAFASDFVKKPSRKLRKLGQVEEDKWWTRYYE